MQLLRNTKIWLVMICLLATLHYPAFSQEKSSGRQTFDLSLGFRRSPQYTISNIPLSIRSVPVHVNDGGSREADPLPDHTFVFGRGTNFDAEISVYTVPFITLGVGITYNPDPSSGVNGVNRIQRNRGGGTERGYGKSLRWYNVYLANFQFVFSGALVSPWIKLPAGLAIRTKAGGRYFPGGIRFGTMSGWDRYDEDEGWKGKTIGRLYLHNIFAELQLAFHESSDPYEPNRTYLFVRVTKFYDRFKLEDGFEDVFFERGIPPTITVGIGLDVIFRNL